MPGVPAHTGTRQEQDRPAASGGADRRVRTLPSPHRGKRAGIRLLMLTRENKVQRTPNRPGQQVRTGCCVIIRHLETSGRPGTLASAAARRSGSAGAVVAVFPGRCCDRPDSFPHRPVHTRARGRARARGVPPQAHGQTGAPGAA
ncbi:hypothetical protein GCM10010358_63000 [Streptomyces minutiscleroticus]|uniref:Uncharacterized protein n=1 Tax=Streptomyces minutiscleroticus TaxID=68238 RepID=A0A918U702_9ACTN|nr:hypothetical protein GCM10010358_63000 [Streptomyces minutiscleroticus]